jgi:hypothetical protein
VSPPPHGLFQIPQPNPLGLVDGLGRRTSEPIRDTALVCNRLPSPNSIRAIRAATPAAATSIVDPEVRAISSGQ